MSIILGKLKIILIRKLGLVCGFFFSLKKNLLTNNIINTQASPFLYWST